jgi:heme exporter protein B
VTLARSALSVAAKDLTIEIRGRHALGAAVPFVATVLLAMGLALGPGRGPLRAAAPGLLWLAVLFGAVLAFRHSYRAEAEDDALEGLVLGSIDKAAVFLGKAAAVAVQLLFLELLLLVMTAGLFDLSLLGRPLLLLAALVLGTVGLSAIGSLFGVLAESEAASEGLLPVLVFPLATPVLLAGVRATSLADSSSAAGAMSWLGLLVAFDVSVLAVGTLVFGYVMEER